MPRNSNFKLLAAVLLASAATVAKAADFVATNAIVSATNTVSAAASTAVATGAGLPDTGASLVRVMGALLLVIAIFLGGVWLFRNWQRLTAQKSGGAKLNLLEVKSLGQRQALYVVGYQQQRMLLASSPSGITLVSHLPEADEADAAAAKAPAVKMNFAEAFQQVLNRKS